MEEKEECGSIGLVLNKCQWKMRSISRLLLNHYIRLQPLKSDLITHLFRPPQCYVVCEEDYSRCLGLS